MLSLILTSILSFLFLSTMVSLRLLGFRFKQDSIFCDIFKKIDEQLSGYLFSLKKKIKKYENGLPLLVFVGKFLLLQVIKLFDVFSFILKKMSSVLKRYLKKAGLKEKNKTVSEYLRSISDYKNNER